MCEVCVWFVVRFSLALVAWKTATHRLLCNGPLLLLLVKGCKGYKGLRMVVVLFG